MLPILLWMKAPVLQHPLSPASPAPPLPIWPYLSLFSQLYSSPASPAFPGGLCICCSSIWNILPSLTSGLIGHLLTILFKIANIPTPDPALTFPLLCFVFLHSNSLHMTSYLRCLIIALILFPHQNEKSSKMVRILSFLFTTLFPETTSVFLA